MGSLTINRKRADESFCLNSPLLSASINPTNCSYYSHQIDTNILKKPRVSYINQIPLKKVQLQSPVARLQKYPEPVGKFRKEVHAPCRAKRVGFWSSLSNRGFKPRVSEAPEKEEHIMGNVFGSAGTLWREHGVKKHAAFGVGKGEKEVVERKEEVVSEESSEVAILEDGNEARSMVSDEWGGFESKGLSSVIESRDFDMKVLENSVVTDGNILHSISLDREAYKKLLSTVDKNYSPKLRSLSFEIKSNEAKLQSLRSLESARKHWKVKKLEELKKPEEDFLHEPFIPLSEEEEGEVKRALLNSNRRKVLVTHENSNIQITGEILQCLRPGAWLNDEVINVYLELLKERERREPNKYLNCHFFNTFFYKKLIGGGSGYDYKAVRRWTTLRKLGYKLSECDKIFVPIHKEVHWCLAVINKKDKSFQYLDSLGGRDLQVLRVLAKYYVDEVKDKCGQDIDVSSWQREYIEDLPEQQNGFDCGVFMIKYADFYSRGVGLHFSQENMPYFRLRTAKEILRLQAH